MNRTKFVTHSNILICLTVVLGLSILGLLVLLDPFSTTALLSVGPLLFSFLATLFLSFVTVEKSNSILEIHSTIFRKRVFYVNLRDVASVELIDGSYTAWGGIGYRFLPRGKALLLGGDKAVQFKTNDGSELIVKAPKIPDLFS